MRWRLRAPALPPAVRERVPGRPLAWARAADGTWLVGTRSVLVVAGDEVRVLPWETVQHADWDADRDTLTVVEVTDYGTPVASAEFVLDDPGSLPTLVRERVTASIVVTHRVELARRRGFTVVGRRSPAGSGEVTWAYELDAGVDPEEPSVRAAAAKALEQAQDSVGLSGLAGRRDDVQG